MSSERVQDTRTYTVIKNHVSEFRVWLANRPVPFSWRDVHRCGTQEECQNYIDDVMRIQPLEPNKDVCHA